jgi:hypothetical protein
MAHLSMSRVKVLAACSHLPKLLYHQADLMGNYVKMEVIRVQTQLVYVWLLSAYHRSSILICKQPPEF